MTEPVLFPLRVRNTAPVADGIQQFELVADDGGRLPGFTPGCHIHVKVPNGMVRRYSLINGPDDSHAYHFAVKREANGTGGSLSLVDDTKVGDVLYVSTPQNDFPLATTAKSHIFIAGGIGITPILSMARHLAPQNGAYKIFYLARTPEMMAFRDELTGPDYAGHVITHFDHGDPDRAYDLWPALEKPAGAHVYCCGPRGLMESVRDMTGHWPSSSVHFEDFGTTTPAHSAEDREFTVRLARRGTTLTIPADVSILDTLRAAGIDIASSCESGSCGTCEVKLLEGIADHRDLVLAEHEKSSLIMVCVSRAKSAELVLDL